MKRADGEWILFWTMPALAVLWVSAFVLFPGFVHPMAPTMPADEVAAFYLDPANLGRIRASMILFNWFCIGIVIMLALLVMQTRRMAHRTPIFRYSLIACAAGGPVIFLVADIFWLLAAFRPDRSPDLTQVLNDLAWVTFTAGVPPFLIGQCLVLALAIYLDDQPAPVFGRWVAHFNVLIAVLLVPAAFSALVLEGPLAWDGALSFWVKNAAIGIWIAVMSVLVGRNIHRDRAQVGDDRRAPAAGVAA